MTMTPAFLHNSITFVAVSIRLPGGCLYSRILLRRICLKVHSELRAGRCTTVVLVVGVDFPLEALLVDAVVQRHPNVHRAVRDVLLPSAATFERVDQSSDTSNK